MREIKNIIITELLASEINGYETLHNKKAIITIGSETVKMVSDISDDVKSKTDKSDGIVGGFNGNSILIGDFTHGYIVSN